MFKRDFIQSENQKNRPVPRKGQSAIEYIVLSTAIAIVVLIGFDEKRGLLVLGRNLTEGMFNQAVRGIMGTPAADVARTMIDSSDNGTMGYP